MTVVVVVVVVVVEYYLFLLNIIDGDPDLLGRPGTRFSSVS